MPTDVSHRPLLPAEDVWPVREIWRRPGSLTWSATLGRDGPRIALRTLTRSEARAPVAARAFRLRQREVARLGHAGIVGPLAVGMVDERLSARSGGHLSVGAPAVALPWVPGRRLSASPALPWEGVHGLLDQALTALGHAHAREVLHLDLRPSSLLVRPDESVALIDFGVPTPGPDGVRRAPAEVGRSAPELMDGDWTRIGPWTDIYALAGLAWELLTGGGAHAAANRRATRFRQLQAQTVAFQPRVPVPTGLAPLLRAWLHPDPAGRPASAAAARHALAQLGNAPSDTALDEPTLEASAPPRIPVRRVSGVPAVPAPHAAGSLRPPLLLPLGRLRDAPTVGREVEQHALWAAMDDVERTGRSHLALLHGPSGSGRHHLARWLALRATEEDLVDGVIAAHHDDAWQGGLAAAARRSLRLDQATGAAASEAAARVLGGLHLPWEGLASALAAWLAPHGAAPGWPMPGLLHGLLLGLARSRPLLLVVRDLDRSAATRRAIAALLRRQATDPVPVLVVGTVGPGGVPDLPPARPGGVVRHVHLGPLHADAALGIAAHLAPVGRRLARALHTQSGGLPLDLRLATRVGARPEAPYDRGRAWARRLAQAVRDPAEAALLARGAVLGRHVDRAELEAAWPDPLPQDLAERLEDEGLGVRTASGWRFAHESLHRHVLRMVHDGRAHHLACAEALESLGAAEEGPVHRVRIARHRLHAGDATGAWHAAMAAAEQAEAQARPAVLVDALGVAAAALPAEASGRRRIELDIRLQVARSMGGAAAPESRRLRAAVAAADAAGAADLALLGATAHVQAGGRPSSVGLAARVRAAPTLAGHAAALLVLARAQGAEERPGAAFATAERAAALPPAAVTPQQRAEAEALCARLLLQQGDPVEASARARSLLRAPRPDTGAHPRAVARRVLAEVAGTHARPEEALRQWRAVQAEHRRLDDDAGLAHAEANIAVLADRLGETEEARSAALRALRRVGQPHPAPLRLHLAALAEDWDTWDMACAQLPAPRPADAAHLAAAAALARRAGQLSRAARLPTP